MSAFLFQCLPVFVSITWVVLGGSLCAKKGIPKSARSSSSSKKTASSQSIKTPGSTSGRQAVPRAVSPDRRLVQQNKNDEKHATRGSRELAPAKVGSKETSQQKNTHPTAIPIEAQKKTSVIEKAPEVVVIPKKGPKKQDSIKEKTAPPPKSIIEARTAKPIEIQKQEKPQPKPQPKQPAKQQPPDVKNLNLPRNKMQAIIDGMKHDEEAYPTMSDVMSDWQEKEGKPGDKQPAKRPEPAVDKVVKNTEKEKEIQAGTRHDQAAYPTMDDVRSDWNEAPAADTSTAPPPNKDEKNKDESASTKNDPDTVKDSLCLNREDVLKQVLKEKEEAGLNEHPSGISNLDMSAV
ncbi:unnamed protein product, partial [Mesorhabditis spiculigera]